MKLPKFAQSFVWLALFGLAGLLYGVPYLLSGNIPSWEHVLPSFGILFLFGAWAGLVVLTESEAWLPGFRRLVHSMAFVGLGIVAAHTVASPNTSQLMVIAGICAVVGFFGEKWVKHV